MKKKRTAVHKKSRKKHKKEAITIRPGETLESLMQQKEEIEAFLKSLEDAYNEAAILEDDYNDIKTKNLKRLYEINKKLDILKSSQPGVAASNIPPVQPPPLPPVSPPIPAPVASPTETPVVKEVAKKPKKEEKKRKPESSRMTEEDIKRIESDIVDRMKELVENIKAHITEKDLLEIKNQFSKIQIEIEKIKATVDTVREMKKVSDEKIQKVIEGLAELRTTVYQREAALKEQEVKVEKVFSITSHIEPEKILAELERRDKEISDLKMKFERLEDVVHNLEEMLKHIRDLLQNIGSLENVIRISNEASEKLASMQRIELNANKTLDKVQGLYAELSKRLEEFMLYKAKQDRIDDMLSELTKNVDEMSTKLMNVATQDDLEALKASISAPQPQGKPSTGRLDELKAERDEIKMLIKSLEEELKSGTITKDEFERMKKANVEKLSEIEREIKKEELGQISPELTIEEGEEKEKAIKNKKDSLLKDLEETFKKGMISKKAYEKAKKMILEKG